MHQVIVQLDDGNAIIHEFDTATSAAFHAHLYTLHGCVEEDEDGGADAIIPASRIVRCLIQEGGTGDEDEEESEEHLRKKYVL